MRKRFNQYYLTKQIADNSSGSVYLAHHVSDRPQKVLLEILDTASFTFNQQDENVFQKIKLVKQLKHSSIVPITDLGTEHGQPYVVREYHTWESLRHLLDRLCPQRPSLQEALAIILQVGQVLAYAHQHQVVHGSITPETIFLKRNGEVLLSDFGLADFIDIKKASQESDPRTTSYVAPEQFAGSFTEKSDQYALACLAYELITGCVPFSAQSTFSVISPISVKDLFEKDQAILDQDGSFCENSQCPDYGRVGKGNVRKYGRTRKGAQRWQCRTCQTTWSTSSMWANDHSEFLAASSDLVTNPLKSIQEAVLKATAKDPSDRYADVSHFLKVLEEAWPSALSVISQQSLMVPPSNTTKVPTVAERREDLESETPASMQAKNVFLTTRQSRRSEKYKGDRALLTAAGDTYTETPRGRRFSSSSQSPAPTLWLAFALSGIILLLGTMLVYILVPLRPPASTSPVKSSATASIVPTLQISITSRISTVPVVTPTPIPLPQISYEAESSQNTLNGGAQVIGCPACSGQARVGYIGLQDNGNNGSLQFNDVRESSTNTYAMTIYYTEGDSGGRIGYISVNGGPAIAFTAAYTGSFWTVGSINVMVSLSAGNNTLLFYNSNNQAPDIDRIVV